MQEECRKSAGRVQLSTRCGCVELALVALRYPVPCTRRNLLYAAQVCVMRAMKITETKRMYGVVRRICNTSARKKQRCVVVLVFLVAAIIAVLGSYSCCQCSSVHCRHRRQPGSHCNHTTASPVGVGARCCRSSSTVSLRSASFGRSRRHSRQQSLQLR